MHPSSVKEGKIEVIADCDGLLKVDSKKLEKVNSFGELMIATRHGNTTVKRVISSPEQESYRLS